MAACAPALLVIAAGLIAAGLYVAAGALLYVTQRAVVFPGQAVRVGDRPSVAGLEVFPLSTAS